jgi:hypothetical protein
VSTLLYPGKEKIFNTSRLKPYTLNKFSPVDQSCNEKSSRHDDEKVKENVDGNEDVVSLPDQHTRPNLRDKATLQQPRRLMVGSIQKGGLANILVLLAFILSHCLISSM